MRHGHPVESRWWYVACNYCIWHTTLTVSCLLDVYSPAKMKQTDTLIYFNYLYDTTSYHPIHLLQNHGWKNCRIQSWKKTSSPLASAKPSCTFVAKSLKRSTKASMRWQLSSQAAMRLLKVPLKAFFSLPERRRGQDGLMFWCLEW